MLADLVLLRPSALMLLPDRSCDGGRLEPVERGLQPFIACLASAAPRERQPVLRLAANSQRSTVSGGSWGSGVHPRVPNTKGEAF